jgi:hypothetical protein
MEHFGYRLEVAAWRNSFNLPRMAIRPLQRICFTAGIARGDARFDPYDHRYYGVDFGFAICSIGVDDFSSNSSQHARRANTSVCHHCGGRGGNESHRYNAQPATRADAWSFTKALHDQIDQSEQRRPSIVIGWVVSYGSLSGGAICSLVGNDAEPPNIDDPQPIKPTSDPGMVVHWDAGSADAQPIAHFFDSCGVRVSVSHRLPPNASANFIWIDIGPGSPWKNP